MTKIGVLLTNTGTPDAPTTKAVKAYLKEFLSDRRIVKIPRVLWYPILYGVILPLRPKKSAELYKSIWTEQGSPMRVIMENISAFLNQSDDYICAIGMNYGKPTIQQAINKLIEAGAEEIILLPLYPQYSFATTASTYDRLASALQNYPEAPKLHFINDYYAEPAYIEALSHSIQKFWQEKGRGQHLLISFHGIPERFVKAGDPYAKQCQQTAQLLTNALELKDSEWTLCFQSKFGYGKWLEPSTQVLFEELPKQGIKNIDVICPGFSVDCLETLEEIAITGAEDFKKSGGETFRYIPALNDSSEQIQMIKRLLTKQLNTHYTF